MADVSSSGQILEKTTRTRIISENSPPDFWDYIEKQNLPDPEHMLYLYLQRDSRNIPYGTYTSHFPLRDGRLVPINDREAFEAAIQARFGGGIWRLILKQGKQRRCETRVFTGDGPTLLPPSDAAPDSQGAAVHPSRANTFGNFIQPETNSTAQIAAKAIDVVAGQESAAVNLGLGMMTTAADVMKRFADRSLNGENPAPNGAPAPGSPEADLRNALTQALVARLAMDPLQQFSQMFAVMRELSNAGNGGGVGSKMDEFRTMLSFARELIGGTNPGAPAASTGAAIVNVLPGVLSAGVDIARAWQVGKEAERDTVALAMQPQGRPGIAAHPMSHPGVPVPLTHSPFNPPPRPLPPAPQPQPNPAPIVAAAPGAITPPSTEFIEARIVEILRVPIPAEDAARRALEFLYTLSGENPAVSYVTQLVVLGETGLVNLFHMRPILKPATADMARLLEFIRSFIRFNAEEEAERAKDRKPN